MTKSSKPVSTTPRSKRLIRSVIYSPLPAVVAGWILYFGQYDQNRIKLYLGGNWLPLILIAIPIVVSYFIYLIAFRKRFLPILVASIALAVMLNDFDYRFDTISRFLKTLLPLSFANVQFMAILVLGVLITAAGLLSIAIEKLIDFLEISTLAVTQFIVVTVLIVGTIQIVQIGMFYINIHGQYTYKPPPITLTKATVSIKPDIYYLVFDRYTSQQNLTKLYGFDNSPFIDKLQHNGFVVRNPAWANYPFTLPSIASTLSLNYLTDIEKHFDDSARTEFPIRAIYNNPPIADALKQFGYKYHHLGFWWDETKTSKSADVDYTDQSDLNILGIKLTLSEFEVRYFESSIYRELLSKYNPKTGDRMPSTASRTSVSFELGKLNDIATQGSGGRYIFAHLPAPHPPYVFDADGAIPNYDINNNETGIAEKHKYINELVYINTQIEQLVDNILSHAKTPPIIVIQADEGPYPFEGTPLDIPKLDQNNLERKIGILAAYHLPGADATKIDSSVNVFRYILNTYFGQKMDYLPDCSFVFKGADLKHYLELQDYTKRLRGSEDPRCSTIHTSN